MNSFEKDKIFYTANKWQHIQCFNIIFHKNVGYFTLHESFTQTGHTMRQVEFCETVSYALHCSMIKIFFNANYYYYCYLHKFVCLKNSFKSFIWSALFISINFKYVIHHKNLRHECILPEIWITFVTENVLLFFSIFFFIEWSPCFLLKTNATIPVLFQLSFFLICNMHKSKMLRSTRK